LKQLCAFWLCRGWTIAKISRVAAACYSRAVASDPTDAHACSPIRGAGQWEGGPRCKRWSSALDAVGAASGNTRRAALIRHTPNQTFDDERRMEGDELRTNTSICSDIRLGDERLAARTASPFTHSQSWAHTPYIIHGRLHTLERTYTCRDYISLSSTAHTRELNTPPPMATHARDHGDYTRKPTSFSLFRPLSTSPQFIHSERLPTIAALGAPLIMAAELGFQRNHARPDCPRTGRTTRCSTFRRFRPTNYCMSRLSYNR
jgi:hypothetical protein